MPIYTGITSTHLNTAIAVEPPACKATICLPICVGNGHFTRSKITISQLYLDLILQSHLCFDTDNIALYLCIMCHIPFIQRNNIHQSYGCPSASEATLKHTCKRIIHNDVPDSKVHGANMGPTWVLSAPDGPLVDPMKLAIRGHQKKTFSALLVLCEGNPPVTGGFPIRKASDAKRFFDMRLNKRLSKQSGGR